MLLGVNGMEGRAYTFSLDRAAGHEPAERNMSGTGKSS
jgi:hypothetical protein